MMNSAQQYTCLLIRLPAALLSIAPLDPSCIVPGSIGRFARVEHDRRGARVRSSPATDGMILVLRIAREPVCLRFALRCSPQGQALPARSPSLGHHRAGGGGAGGAPGVGRAGPMTAFVLPRAAGDG